MMHESIVTNVLGNGDYTMDMKLHTTIMSMWETTTTTDTSKI